MKKLSSLLSGIFLVFGFCLSASAQESIYWSFPDTITKVATSGIGGIYLYTFDDRGNALVTEYLDTDRNGTLFPQQKITSTYNRFDLADTSISYLWINNEYRATARKISSYDSRGNHIFLLNENYNGADGWRPVNRYTYTYNDQNLKTDVLVEKSIENNPSKWVFSEKAEYTYDEKDRETAYEHYVWTGSEWANYRSTFNKYENDLLVEESAKGLDAEGNFIDTYKLSYTYTTAGKPDEWLYQTFVDGIWENAYFRKFGYYADGSDSIYISYEWNLYLTNEWDATVKEIYTNNPDGQRAKVEHYTTEGADPGEWFLAVEMEYEYNEAGRRTSYIFNDFRDEGGKFLYTFDLNENNDDVRAACYVKKGEEWASVDKFNLEAQYHDGTSILYANAPAMHEIKVHYASGHKTPIPDVANEYLKNIPDFSIRIWPNPAREILRVEADDNGYFDMALFDLSGHRLESRRAVQHAEFNVSRYHGIYLLRVERNGAVISRKVIVL